VQALEDVVVNIAAHAVYLLCHQKYVELLLKFGQVGAAEQVTPVVTAVRSQLVALEATTPLERYQQALDVHIPCVLEELGLVINRILVVQVWDVVHT